MKNDTALLRQAFDALDYIENCYMVLPQNAKQALETLRKRLHICPACGADTENYQTEYTGITTYYDACTECDWRGEPE